MSSPPPPSLPPPAATEDEEEEATDDDEMDDIQWEEPEDDDNDEEEEERSAVDEGGHRGSAGVSAAAAAVAAMVEVEEHNAEAWPTCCVCMEPWTPDGAHRICCIPCGYVYGRSCLEKWLHRRGNTSAKCRQRFRHKHITNLHVSGNVWDDFCRLQSLSQELEARLAVTDKKIEQLSVDVRSNEENQRLRARLAEANNKLERLLVDIRSEVAEDSARLRVELNSELNSRIAEAHTNLRAQAESQFESIQQSCWQEAAQDAAAVVQAEFLSMKEQMRKMAGEQNATPVDLLRFMEQDGAKLWEAIRSRPPAGGHIHNERRLEQLDHEPSCGPVCF